MRTFSTSQVVRLLELHPDWEFQARVTFADGVSRHRVRGDGSGVFPVFEADLGSDAYDRWMRLAPYNRSDWTRVKPAKVKRERLNLGTFKTNASGNQDGLGLGLADAALKLYHMATVTTGTWTLYAVKDGGK